MEIFRLYEYHNKLEPTEFKRRFASWLNLTMTVLMAAASGFIAWGLYFNAAPDPWHVIIAGIAARTLVSKPLELNVSRPGPDLGDHGSRVADQEKVTLRDLYG